MGEPELVSRDFKSFKSLSLSFSFHFVLVENANLIARRAISGLSSIRFDQTRALSTFQTFSLLNGRVLLRRIDNLGKEIGKGAMIGSGGFCSWAEYRRGWRF